MVARILRKLGLGHAAYKLAAPVVSGKYQHAVEKMTEQEALELLYKTSPDAGSSSCVSSKGEEAAAGVCLDIIIPAYNVEPYIARCVESVLEQESSYSFRVLVIDDGSSDGTGSILDRYEGIHVIHQENRGFSGARNRGLALASAEYLMFLDADDCLCPGAVEKLMQLAKERDAGIVEGGYTEVTTEGKLIRRHSHKAGILNPINDCEGYIWGKVIKRELFQGLAFPHNYWYQDSIVRQLLLPLAKKQGQAVWGIEDSVVLYRQNPGGITKKSRGSSKSLDSFYITRQLFEDRKQLELPLTGEYYDYILSMAVQTYSRTRLQPEEVKQALFLAYANFVEKNFPGFHTRDKKLACLERALYNRDYGTYRTYCQLH